MQYLLIVVYNLETIISLISYNFIFAIIRYLLILIIPLLQNAQNKSILEIARELNILQEKGMKRQLGLNDLSGGTFTISNIGIVSTKYSKS